MPKQWTTPPAMQIDPKKKYKARMETDKGTMVIELFADKAPKTVNNFVFLAREGYYEGDQVPSCDFQLYGAGRRPNRPRLWRTRL